MSEKKKQVTHANSDPLIYTGIGHYFGPTVHYQYHAMCRNFELNLAECIEAYGFYKGQVKCEALIHDLQECLHHEKKKNRNEIILGEFVRQVKAGERNYEKVPFIPFS